MKNTTKIPKEFIISLNGKDYIKHQGLLWLAHRMGLVSINTKFIGEHNIPDTILFIAEIVMDKEVTTKDGTRITTRQNFNSYGDASKYSIKNSMLLPHLIRMAETRAINRALRLATGIGMTSYEELGGEHNDREISN